MIPELQSPIPTANAASAFLSVNVASTAREKNSEGKKTEEMWKPNVLYYMTSGSPAQMELFDDSFDATDLGSKWYSRQRHFDYFISIFDLL